MSATMAGAFKGWLETLGLNMAWYRDGAPLGANNELLVAFPYGVVQEGIGMVGLLHGDYGDAAAHLATDELVQVDLFQEARHYSATAGRAVNGEQYGLSDTLSAALQNGALGVRGFAPWRVYGVTIEGGQRWPPKDNIIRNTWTVRVHRDTRRSPA